MDPKELIEYANVGKEVATAIGSLLSAAGASVYGHKMLGALSNAAGRRWNEAEDRRAWERQHKTLQKAVEFCEETGADPRTIPVKILAPWLEGVALEENEDLQTMWAALLAKAANSKDGDKVRPSFISILKEMAVDEAAVLSWILKHHEEVNRFSGGGYWPDRSKEAENPPGLHFDTLMICLNRLESVRLLRMAVVVNRYDITLAQHSPSVLDNDGPFHLTELGFAFLDACQPPNA